MRPEGHLLDFKPACYHFDTPHFLFSTTVPFRKAIPSNRQEYRIAQHRRPFNITCQTSWQRKPNYP